MPTHPSLDGSAVATCAAMYCADLVPAYAFVFRVDSTRTSFTIYDSDPDRYLIGATYVLTVAEPAEVPLRLDPDDWRFLRHCLDTLTGQWRDAIAEADAGATRPRTPGQPTEAGQLNIEPTPHGYQAIGRAFRDELDRVTRLAASIDRLLDRPVTDAPVTDAPDTGPSDTGPSDTGPSDTGPSDTGPSDTHTSDAGSEGQPS